jgi:hypothetical protein
MEPLYKDSTEITGKVLLEFMGMIKVEGTMQRALIEDVLKTLHNRLLPQPNFLPPSCYMIEQVLDIPKWNNYSNHVCDRQNCKGYVWEKLDPADYGSHIGDMCPNCNQPRIQRVESFG